MNRQPTLAEILSDDTGKIRAEVADLLLEPRRLPIRPRVRVAEQARPRRLPFGRGWIAMGLIVVVAIWGIGVLNDQRPHRAKPGEIAGAGEYLLRPAAQPMPTIPLQETAQTSSNNVGTGTQAAKGPQDADIQSVPPAPSPAGKTGRVIGDAVCVRMRPNLEAGILSRVSQDDIVEIVSFENGWYQVTLADNTRGYVFGAYVLLPDAEAYPHRAASLKTGGIKILVRDAGRPNYFLAFWPDGQTTWILKEDVEVHR